MGLVGTAILPCQVGELGVDGAGDHLCIDGTKLMHTITECNDLSGADKCAAKERTNTFMYEYVLLLCNNPSNTNEVSVYVCVSQMLLTSPGDRRKRQDICLCSLTASAL